MNLKFIGGTIRFEKELNSLDYFLLDFVSVLNKLKIDYVIVSGYVSILFGRSRTSEDIDIIIKKLTFDKFNKLWAALTKRFECLNTHNAKEAYEDLLLTGHSIRLSRKNEFIPNIELKFTKTDLESWVLQQKNGVVVNEKKLFISSIELQISFKLFLGSEKDIEDARYLYNLFRDKIDSKLLNEFNRKLKIEGLFNQYLK